MTERTQVRQRVSEPPYAARAVVVLIGRVALVGAASILVWVLFLPTGATAFPPSPLFAALAMLPVNLVCLWWARRLVHDRGSRLRDLIGYSRARLGRDVLWGLLWLVVLYVPFALTVLGVMALQYGDATFAAFETVFFDPASVPDLPRWAMTILAVVAVLTFAPLNAPVEELVYRGYGQRGLATRMPVALAITVSALFFGLQHIFYAPTSSAALAYACAFFVWGAGSGIIAHRQGRLMPIIVAHFAVNLFTSAPALAIAWLPQ
ncbi:CPBP family intramembrane glutamic endopeptidase [Microbacterium immunditiarum]|uniref:CAAX prenyl protease 2/Lysostaphin resistance protein A-like domain-containing protein n=1 Tax=Microbacterium immunditiarum TaxID=337480 RepID=A0A7Y9GNF8_9MICO|nr:CPBP family intramembrane glutamic endopeptidase [Microbacterium immunditiarum]NYE19743.1 hypothetical protein [Microbacterium immunditiarum]